MPRTVPAGILALQGVATTRAPLFLVEIRFPGGTGYYSSGEAVSFGGNSYAANRVTISTFEAGLIDRKNRNFSRVDIRLDNLADNGSSSFPFTVIEAAANPEDSLVFIHVYSPDAADGVANVFWGYLGARKYDGSDKYASYSISFFWDALEAKLPTKLVHQAGFDVSEGAAQLSEDGTEEMCIPVVYGSGNLKVRPLIYSHWTEGEFLHVNFIVTGCNGLPMEASYLINPLLWGTTSPITFEILLGSAGQTAPANLTRFPDGGAHPNIAYGYAVYAIKNEDKTRADDLRPDDIKANITNGRPLIDTTIPSENAALILKDFLRDPNFSTGLPSALFDSITSTANYIGTRYQMRFEFHEQKSVTETVQYILANFHGFITFENGLIQIKAKRNDETSIASFATIEGGSGRKIDGDFVDTWVKDSSELINKFSVKYRRKRRNRRWVTLYDSAAQARAGGTQKKEVEDELDQWDNGGVYEEAQAAILAAIAIREDQNGNLFAAWASPIWDCIDISVGDLVTVTSPDIFNNVSNTTYRVIRQSFDTGDLPLVHFEAQIYKAAIYNDDSVALGVDLLRGGDFTDAQGRPPDVVPVSLNIIDVTTNDVEGKMADMLAVWTYPTVDMSSEQADGLYREFPIAETEIWWRYTDESINAVRRGGSVKYPTAQLNFQVDFKKTKSVEAFFVAIGHNRARAPLGYIPDPTKVTSLTGILAANPAITANVVSSTLFTVNDYVQIEKEIVQLLSKTGTSLTFVSSGGNRTTFFDSSAIAHPTGTEVSVAKQSYPSLTRSLAAPRFTYPTVGTPFARQRPLGVKIRIPDVSADNVEDYFTYWSITGDPGGGSATPAWYVADPLTPTAGIEIVRGKMLHFTIPQEDIGPAGTVVYVRIAARNGKHNWSAALSPLAQDSVGDDGVPVVSTQPTLVPKPHGLRVKVVMPTANMETFPTNGKVEIVLQAKDAGSAILGYLSDASGTGWTSSASEFRFDEGLSRTKTYPIGKGVLTTLWPTISTLAVYAYVTNAVGTSAASPSRSVIVSTWEVDEGIPADTAVPSGLNTPKLKAKKNGLAAHGMYATTQNAQHQYTEVVFYIRNDAGALLDWIDPLTNAGAGSEAPAIINIAKSGQMELNISRSQLITAFGGPSDRNIGVYYYVTNLIGPSAQSPITVIPFSSLIADDQTEDTAAPGVVQNLALRWSNKKGFKASWDRPATNIKSLKGYYVDFSGVTNWMNAETGQIASPNTMAGAEVFVTDTRCTTGLKLAELHSSFITEDVAVGVTAVNIVGGVETRGTRVSSSRIFATDPDAVTPDTAVPAGLQTQVMKTKKNGVAVHNMYATSQNAQHQYTEVIYYVVNGTNTIFIGILDPATNTSSGATPIWTNIGKSGDHFLGITKAQLVAAFGGPTDRQLVVNYRVTNLIGTTTGAVEALVTFASLVGDDLAEDTAAASAVQNLTLVWGAKKKGYKSTWARPATNANSIRGYKVVYMDNAGTNFMNAETGALASPNTEAGGTIFVTDTRHTTGLELSQLAAQFTAGVKVKVTPVNVVLGVETDGSSATSSFVAPSGSEAAGDDTAAPGGTLSAPTVKKLKRSALKLDLVAPTTNNLKLRSAEVYISNTAHTLWLTAGDLTSSTASESFGAIVTNPTGGVTIPVDRSVLEAIFGAGATIHVYAKWINDIGTSAASGNATYVLSSGEAGAGQVDTAVPSSLGTPVLSFIAKVGVHIAGMTVGAGWNQPHKKYIVIYDGTSTYLDLPNYFAGTQVVQAAGSESAARYEIGAGKDHITLGIRLQDLKNVLGTSMRAYFYAENLALAGTLSSASTASNTITLANAKDIVSSRDAVNVVDIGTTLLSPQQIAINGDMFYSDGSGNVNAWARCVKTSGAIQTDNLAISTTTTDPVFWDSLNHQLKMIDVAHMIVQSFKKRIPKGDFFSILVALKTDGSFGSGVLNLDFGNDANSPSVVTTPTVDLVKLTSSYQLFGFVFQMDTSSAYPARKWLRIYTSTTLSATNNIIIDKIMLVRGKQPTSYAARGTYEGDSSTYGTAEDINLGSMSAAVVVDTGSPSGSQGGYIGSGSGDLIIPRTN